MRKSDQIEKAAVKPSSHGGAANKIANAALAKIKQPSAVSKVVTSILNAIKSVVKVVTKIIAAPFVLADKAIVALGQSIIKVAKALNPIAAYKKYQAKKTAVIKDAQDFEATFGQGLTEAMTVLADKTSEHEKMTALAAGVVAAVLTRGFKTQPSLNDGPGTPGDLPKLMPASPTSSNVSAFDTTPPLSAVSSPR